MGACSSHYQSIHAALHRGDSREEIALRLGMTLETFNRGYVRRRAETGGVCCGSSCEEKVNAKGFCVKHYQSIRRLLGLRYSLEVIARHVHVSLEDIRGAFELPEDYPVRGGPEIVDKRLRTANASGLCYIPACETQESTAGACKSHYQAIRRWIWLKTPLEVIAARYALTVDQLLEHVSVPPDYPREAVPELPEDPEGAPDADSVDAPGEERISLKMLGGLPVAISHHHGRLCEGVRWVSYRRPFDPEDRSVRRRLRKDLPDPWYLALEDGKW